MQEKTYFEPSWIQRNDDVVCMVIEYSFGILHFWFIYADHRDLIQMRYTTSNADADCGNTQIGYVAEGTRNQTTI